ncbi:ATP-binding cassette domain-containing protein [Pseudomonas fluorescens]|uniref:peptidase domain-containing ABC transporter n=1 Tax=Pseudomonas fluorescens TaxID=294 RepID=UPI001130B12D|nr:ATP-binding cassette domain-containing protein [Pseudomonas fluorescens]TMU73967.1 ATP-binding cassette domain-containing protein [Pseudomonas fluorescens]
MPKPSSLHSPHMVFQGEVADCGLACVAMLAQSVGKHIELAELRERFAVSTAGASLAKLVEMLQAYGIKAYPVQFEQASVADLPMPAILHYGGNHFVVAADAYQRHVRLLNPATGSGVFSEKSLSAHLSGFAILLEPDQDMPVQGNDRGMPPQAKPSWLSLRAMTIPRLPLMLIVNSLIGATGFLLPALLSRFIDGGANLPPGEMLSLLGAAGALTLMACVTELYLAKVQLRIGNGLSMQWIPQLFARMTRNPAPFFEQRAMADISQRLLSFAQAVRDLSGVRVGLYVSASVCVTATAALLWIHPWLGALVVATIGGYGLISAYYSSLRTALLHRVQELSSDRNALVFETIQGIEVIRSANLFVQRLTHFSQKHASFLAVSCDLSLMEVRQRVWYKFIGGVETILALAIAMYLFSIDRLSLGTFFAFFFVKQVALSASTEFYMALMAIRANDITSERALDIVQETAQHAAPVTEPVRFEHQLKLSQVEFAYAGSEVVVNNISLAIRPGEKVAVIGGSGSGKSTLIKLLAGVYAAKSGGVSIDGQAAGARNLGSLAFYQPANAILFKASVRDNLSLFGTADPQVRLEHLAEQLNLTDCIQGLPHGWNTLICEANPLMSSGQRQRLLVARALANTRPIMVLDEPTANLDHACAQHTLKIILASPKTVIMALHDHSLLNYFDQVISLSDGQIQPPGSCLGDASSRLGPAASTQ